MDRNLDGVYFRVEREGQWVSLCFSDLTAEQMDAVLDNRSTEWLKSLCVILGKTIRRLGDDLDIISI